MSWLKTVCQVVGYAIQLTALAFASLGYNGMVWILWIGFVVIISADDISGAFKLKR